MVYHVHTSWPSMIEPTCPSHKIALTVWKKLDMSPSAPSDNEAVEDLEKCLVDEFELINQHFSFACYSK